MDFKFSQEEEAWRKQVRDFLDREASPEVLQRLMKEQDCSNPHSPELYAKLAANGYIGITWPKKYGGQELSNWHQYIFNEELSKSYVPFGTQDCLSVSTVYTGEAIMAFGTEEQKQKWLPQIVKGEFTCAIGITEPNAGSDAANAELRADRKDGRFVLNGTKIFNCAHLTNHAFVLGRTDPEAHPKHRGLSIFIVPFDTPGISVSPNYRTVGGMRRSEVAFEDAEISEDQMLGEENRGWRYVMQAMLFERTQHPGPGELEMEFGRLIEHVKRARFQGQPLSQIPAVRYALAEIEADIEVSRLLAKRVCWLQGRGEANLGDASASMVFLTEMMERASNKCLDILGQSGLLESRDELMSLHDRLVILWRDSRSRKILSGTSEIQRNVIAMASLNLPRG